DPAFAYVNNTPKAIRRVTDENDRSFPGGALELRHRNGGDVGLGPQPLGNTVACSESGETEGCDESGRLFGSDTGESGELLRLRSPEARDTSKVPGEFPRGLQAAFPSLAAL